MKNIIPSILISLIIPIITLILGDALFIGLWYYLIVPFIFISLSAFFRLTSSFYIGLAIAIGISFLIYLYINFSSNNPEGLLGLGHLFSLPGALFTSVIVAYFIKRYSVKSIVFNVLLGFFGFVIGFFVNQFVVCNTVMYCKYLSF